MENPLNYLLPEAIPFHWVNERDKTTALNNNSVFSRYQYSDQFVLKQRIDSIYIEGFIAPLNKNTSFRFLQSYETMFVPHADYKNRIPVYISFDNVSLYLLTGIHYTNPTTFIFKKLELLRHTVKDSFFMIMPFRFKTLNDFYLKHIKAYLKSELNINVYRSDDFVGNDIIIETIHQQIEQAEIIIAEVSRCNKNVFYELGYASALGKEILMIQNKDIKISSFFDRDHIRCLRYSPKDHASFKQELKNNIIGIRSKS